MMVRLLSIAFWILSAALAVAFAVVFGLYGWAAILVWSVLVLPLTVYQRQRLNRSWPSQSIRNLWILAVLLNIGAGILPPIVSTLALSETVGSIVGWILVAVIWSGAVAALLVLVCMTAAAIRELSSHERSAA